MEQVEAQDGAVALKNKLRPSEGTEKRENVESNPDPVKGPDQTLFKKPVQTEANGSVHSPSPVQSPTPVQKPLPNPSSPVCSPIMVQAPFWIPVQVNGSVSAPFQFQGSPGQVPLRTQTNIPTLVRIVVRTSDPVQSSVAAPFNVRVPPQNLVQNPVRPPVIVQTKTQIPAPIQNPASVNASPSLSALVQTVDQVRIPVQTQALLLAPDRTVDPVKSSAPTNVPPRNPVQNPPRPPATVETRAPVPPLTRNPAPVSTCPSRSAVVRTVDQVKSSDLPSDPFRPDPSLVRISLPPEAVRSLSPPPTTTPLMPSVPPLGFRLNGRLIPLLPGTEGRELFIRSHPSGSKSSLTSLHLPFHLNVPPPTRKPHPPVISGVVSGESAPAPPKPKPSATATKLLKKGEVVRVPPPDCSFCKSHYRPVPELRAFICMCSSDIAQSLRKMKMKKKEDILKSKLKQKHKTIDSSPPQPTLHRPCSSGMSKSLPVQKPHSSVSPSVSQVYSPPPLVCTPPQVLPSPPNAQRGPVGKLVIHLEDFYYGTDPGHGGGELYKVKAVYRCLQCTKTMRNNIRLMHHTTAHTTDGLRCFCTLCLQHFTCPYELQCHQEAVHGACSSTACRICELHFGNEHGLLVHMKSVHKPGEMPYTCQVCGFRSSFFSQVWEHFEVVHVDTKHFLCQYCLRVFRQHTSYQQHVARHQKKAVYRCGCCRLQFLYVKDRQEHQDQLHKTHIRPAQISGLRPGTKLTVRTYRAASEDELQKKPIPVPPKPWLRVQQVRKRRAVESLGQLLAHLDRSEAGRCVECLCQIQDYQKHFPTTVQCSLCAFRTCCSRAYANHMIDHHSDKKKCPLYTSVFTSCPRSESGLSCGSCSFSSHRGDLMAQHLSVSPGHTCSLPPNLSDLSWTPTDYLIHYADEPDSDSEPQSSPLQSTGEFTPIDHLQPSSHLSITRLTRPAHLHTPVAMTITFRGPAHSPKPPDPLPRSHLSILLYSLLHGVLPACHRCKLKRKLISRWTQLQRQQLSNRRWRWDTAGGARWVLTEREQNRVVDEDSVLELSMRALGPRAGHTTRLNWVVDFMLRHELGVDTRSKELRELSGRVVNNTWNKLESLSVAPPRFCCLDEFPVFVAPQDLTSLSPDGLRVWGRREERPLLEVVLCAASDGTLLKPMVLYSGDQPQLPQGFPTNVLMEGGVQDSDWRERATRWSKKVWRPHLGSDPAPSLLLLDQHCGHMTPDFLDPVQFSGAQVKHIPMGCSGLVQPLELCVIPVLREFLQVRWSQLVCQVPESISESDMVLTLGCWFSEVCSILNNNKDIIQRSFVYVGLRQKSVNLVQRLHKALHLALIQTPHMATTSQSDVPDHNDIQLDAPNETRDQSKPQNKTMSQFELQIEYKNQSDALNQDEEQVEAVLQTKSQSEPEDRQETGSRCELKNIFDRH